MTDDLVLPDETEDSADEGLPLYVQVASTLRTAILRGLYPVGSRMPTEETLCQRFKVSRHTIREALRQLRTDGLIASRPGSRPVVAAPQPRRPETIAADIGEDFFDYTIGTRLEIASMGLVAIAGDAVGEAGLLAGRDWLRATGYRINIDDGRATCWNEYFIHADYALVGRLLARHVGPLIPLIEDLFELRIARITRAIGAVPMPEAQRERFGAAPGAAALRIEVRCQTADGTMAMINRSLHPGGVITYAIRR